MFKSFSFGGTWINLVAFANDPDIDAQIGRAMQLIAESIASATPICDLSQLGSIDAWDKKWIQIQWA